MFIFYLLFETKDFFSLSSLASKIESLANKKDMTSSSFWKVYKIVEINEPYHTHIGKVIIRLVDPIAKNLGHLEISRNYKGYVVNYKSPRFARKTDHKLKAFLFVKFYSFLCSQFSESIKSISFHHEFR